MLTMSRRHGRIKVGAQMLFLRLHLKQHSGQEGVVERVVELEQVRELRLTNVPGDDDLVHDADEQAKNQQRGTQRVAVCANRSNTHKQQTKIDEHK